jgi:hypothetical protein
VLVAHSYSGVPATIAANWIPDRISRVVYLAAVLALAGRSLFDTFPPAVSQAIQQSADAEGDGWLFPMMDDDMLDARVGDHGLSTQDRVWLRTCARPTDRRLPRAGASRPERGEVVAAHLHRVHRRSAGPAPG